MFISLVRKAYIQIISTSLLAISSGLTNTVFNLRINNELSEASFVVGMVTSLYFLGMLLSAFKISSLIFKIGHVRSYSAFASLFAVAIMVPTLSDNIVTLALMRLITGYAMGALYITIESWMLEQSSTKDRGKFLSFYVIATFCGTALGQLLLKYTEFNTVYPFCIGVIFVSLSIIPVTIGGSHSIEHPDNAILGIKELFKTSPTGFVGCFISGMIGAAIYGLLPIYFDDLNYSDSAIGTLMAATVFGGMFLQYPLGLLSDNFDRRYVLVGICAIAALVVGVMIVQITAGSYGYALILFLFVFGGASFSIYPISLSHACDLVQQENLIEATQGLLLAYSLGSVLGPLGSSFLMHVFGPVGLFLGFIIYYLLLVAFFVQRVMMGYKPMAEEKQDFIPISPTTPVSNELDPRT